MIFKQTKPIKQRFKIVSREKDFSYSQFMIQNKICFDNISGECPMIFDDYRTVLHSLKLSWAFLLTLRMKNLGGFSFPQRFRNGTFKGTNHGYFSEIFSHIYTSFKKCNLTEEKEIIKCLKTSLCFHVSEELGQSELPEGNRFNLLPISFRGFFRRLDKDKKINFFFSLLQSKSLCQSVPESFVIDSLTKHRNQLSSNGTEICEETLEVLRERGRRFGRLVDKLYKPNETVLPSNRATCRFPRNMGGVKGDLVYHDRLSTLTHSNDPKDRMEPFVVGLFGQPGMGKSSLIPQLISALSELFPKVSRKDLVYERSCNVEFWDGYHNQPIVILDDLGQSLGGQDIQEFQTLVSCNSYVLPMADLEDKGRLFNSPIIITTSNLQYGHKLASVFDSTNGILDDASFWRRFTLPIYREFNQSFILKEIPKWTRSHNLIMKKGCSRPIGQVRTLDQTRLFYQRKTLFDQPDPDTKMFNQSLWQFVSDEEIFKSLQTTFRRREKFHENIRKTWTQVVNQHHDTNEKILSKEFFEEMVNPNLPESLGFDSLGEGVTNSLNLCFPSFPPLNPLPVRVEPILEPLKVRIITAGEGDTFCLKPFQRAMWRALGVEKQFCLTHGTNNLETAIERIYNNSSPNDVWISGDYTAATDSVPLSASKALMEGILENIDHEPTKRWVMKELSPHQLIYPEFTGLKPVIQRSGQLMGSLLSFPLLCLLNDCTAQALNLDPSCYLINGDDILMRCSEDLYPIWKDEVKKFGLKLSIGKNYIHKDYGTVNSQLIWKGIVTNSGKQRVLDRRSEILGECLRDLEIQMSETPSVEVHNLFKAVNRQKLSRTVRSISVPVSHGGLSFSWGDMRNQSSLSKRTQILTYLHDLFSKVTPEKGCICIPYLSKKVLLQQDLRSLEDNFCNPVSLEEYHEDFIGPRDLKVVRERVGNNSHLRDLFLNQKIENLPSLSFLHALQIPITDKKNKKQLQSVIDSCFFKSFLDFNQSYSYEEFRKSFLMSTMNLIPHCGNTRDWLLNIFELDLKPDFLNQIDLSYQARSFDSDLFRKSLGCELQPKRFSLPLPEDSIDYSKDVIESFKQLEALYNHPVYLDQQEIEEEMMSNEYSKELTQYIDSFTDYEERIMT